MSEIKTWQERCLERGIGSCEARDEELIELRAALANRDAKLAALEKQEPVAWKWEVLPGAPIAKYQVEKAGVYFEDPAKIGIDINCERSVANYKWTLLYAAAGAAPVPEGWQLVPVEPTPDMCEVVTWDFNRFYAPHEIYKAMLKLAPKDAL